MTEPQLPAGFEELEAVIEWALPTERERYLKRIDSTMEELQAFYDAMAPRAADARDHLEALDLGAMPPAAQRLMWLMFSLICVSFAVEVFRAPRVPDTGSAYIERIGEPASFPV